MYYFILAQQQSGPLIRLQKLLNFLCIHLISDSRTWSSAVWKFFFSLVGNIFDYDNDEISGNSRVHEWVTFIGLKQAVYCKFVQPGESDMEHSYEQNSQNTNMFLPYPLTSVKGFHLQFFIFLYDFFHPYIFPVLAYSHVLDCIPACIRWKLRNTLNRSSGATELTD